MLRTLIYCIGLNIWKALIGFLHVESVYLKLKKEIPIINMGVLGNDNFSSYPHLRFKPNQIMANPPTIINNANDFKTN